MKRAHAIHLADFLRVVRAANAGDNRIRVLAADYPVDWDAYLPDPDARDQAAAEIIQREVLDRGRKALVVFGSLHLYRNRPGRLVDLLPNARWHIVAPVDSAVLGSVLIDAQDPIVGDLPAATLLERGTKRAHFVDGKPVFVSVFGPEVRVRDLVDAVLSFGPEPDESVEPPAALYAGTEYGREVARRRQMLLQKLR